MAENEIQEKKQRRPRKERDDVKMDRIADEFTDRVVHVNRVSKTVKGGKRFAFAALVVVGDQKGRVGFAHAKAKEVPDAIKKATELARRNIMRVPLREGRTLHHDVIGHFGAGCVTLRTAPAGTGIIAGGPMRAIFEAMGIQDVVAKCTGSSNPHNMVRATFDALTSMNSPRVIAAKRGKKVGDIVSRRDGAVANAE
ncbi:MAG: 30S ribosomal protein S5 [Alphaproteobacteria bacterium]|nr:30S ribosomal protein S5 [Alphaproteobacteria bacterium]